MAVTTHPYARYLAAKRTVDDRAINRQVLAGLQDMLPSGPLRVLEVGGGIGTMVTRLLDWRVISTGDYTLLDLDVELLDRARTWLTGWAEAHGHPTAVLPDGIALGDLRVHLMPAELGDFVRAGAAPGQRADLLIANALLDVVDVPTVLPGLLTRLTPGGAYWFTITYDGHCSFQPEDPADEAVLGEYHRDMDRRIRHGGPAGESRAGRHLFGQLRAAGAPVLLAGSSDWVVLPGPDGGYPDDEAHFLECILATIGDALDGRLDAGTLAGWLAARRAQVARGELVYLAHQLDVAGRAQGHAR